MMKVGMGEVCHFIAKYLIEKYHFKSIHGERNDEIFVYGDGVYGMRGKEVIKSEVEDILGSVCKTNHVNEIVNKIARQTYVGRNVFDNTNLNLICLDNGVFDIKENKLISHSPEYNFTSKINVSYIPHQKCPKIEKFLNDILFEEDYEVVQEFVGYLLFRKYMFKKACILIGPTDTGKTTFINLLVNFIGVKNVSGISLQRLSDKFSAINLHYKMINIFDDLPSADMNDTGLFKIATGGGYISGEHKFGNQVSFMNYAKLVYATNKFPSINVNEDERAYYNRWLVFRFENVFGKSNKHTNVRLIDELTTNSEMSGFLNWALVGLRRLLNNGKFSENLDLFSIKMVIQRSMSELAVFAQDCFERSDGNWLSKDEMYEEYKEFCKLNDLATLTKEMLGRELPKYCNYILDGRMGLDTGWRNVKVKKVKPVFGL
jgi:putative DNA primase/helicase